VSSESVLPAGDEVDGLSPFPPYTVWIVLENNLGEMRWWSVDHFDALNDAWEHVTEMAAQEFARTGIEPQLLDE